MYRFQEELGPAHKLMTAPVAEPVSLTEAKAHCVVEHSSDDTLIGSLITAARLHVEGLLSRQLVTATWELSLDRFPCVIEIQKPPLQAVNSITYIDSAGNSQTLDPDNYQVDLRSEPGRIRPAYGLSWPVTHCGLHSVVVNFDCGYGLAAAVPQTLKQAILLLVGHWYQNREAVGKAGAEIALAFETLLWSEKWRL